MSTLPKLFCKPIPDKQPNKILFEKYVPGLKGVIQFRAINIKTDLHLVHQWVNSEYALEYWQMNGQFSQLYAIYQCMEHNPYAHSFIGIFKDSIICQFDVYSVAVDELADHIVYQTNDCGFHLLMAPNEKPIKGLTVSVIQSFLDYYFSFPEALNMYAEPDIKNQKSINLLLSCGFKKTSTVQMSYKTADVYVLAKLE